MRKKFSFNSVDYSTSAFNIAMFILRLSFGLVLMIKHGLAKLISFTDLQNNFYDFMGFGPKASLILALFAEIFCSLLLILGLFTRFACIPLVILMLVVIYGADSDKAFLQSELAICYLTSFIVLILCGPGKISVDAMIQKR